MAIPAPSVTITDQGYYDGQAREFRGFGLVSHLDAETLGSGDDTTLTAPVLTRTWYRVGTEGDDLREGYNTADSQAWPLGQTRYTDLHGEALASLAADELHEARRALRGRVRREEVFGADASEQALHPYTVTEFRYQVHQVQGGEHRGMARPATGVHRLAVRARSERPSLRASGGVGS